MRRRSRPRTRPGCMRRYVIEIEQQIADRAALDRLDQRGHLGRIGGVRSRRLSATSRWLARDELARQLLARKREHPGPRRVPFSWKTISAPAESSSRCSSFAASALKRLRSVSRPARNRLRALAHQRRIGVVVVAAQMQERIDIDVVEFELRDLRLGRVAARSFHDGVVERAALRGLESLRAAASPSAPSLPA